MVRTIAVVAVMMLVASTMGLCQEATTVQLAEPFRQAYQGTEVTGEHVIALWTFDDPDNLTDAGGKGFDMAVNGAQLTAEGRFGGALESFRGHPDEDVKHGVEVNHNAALCPKGAFTIEMWIKPKPELVGYPDGFLIDKKYVANADYQMVLGTADAKTQTRRLYVNLGFGADSARWNSDPAVYEPGTWYHVAFTYDGAGDGRFYRDGVALGGGSQPERKAVAPGTHKLTIGDRIGSLYHGFPGFIDQVRICNGVLEFRPASFAFISRRKAFVRMEDAPPLQFEVTNKSRDTLSGAVCRFATAETRPVSLTLPDIASGTTHVVEYPFDLSLRPDAYQVHARIEIPGDPPYTSEERFSVNIVARPLPKRMPVVMWGVGGVENVVKEIDRLRYIGFTHCLGTATDFAKVWEAGAPVQATSDEALPAAYAMLDEALVNGVGVIAGLSPGRWAASKEEVRQTLRDGTKYDEVDGLYPKAQDFCYNVGVSTAQTYGDFPAFDGALIHTEVRGHSRPSFGDIDRQAFREFSGLEIPDEVETGNGVRYADLKDFPPDRIIPDDHPILVYYKWFWERGDGWNALHTALDRGLKTNVHEGFWTFHDPAARVASRWGNGGSVDYLSHWTYSYPDPIRIGLCTDELFAMAEGSEYSQQVMKMTQVIWYRNQTAPMPGEEAQITDAFFDDQYTATGGAGRVEEGKYRARWEKEIPDAAFPTIAPMQLREAFWSKMARPIQGIMYHGWQSLVQTDSTSGYRYTNPDTKEELKRLVETVLEPLGPALMQVPDRPADVAFLESFASQMFNRRGTYGWNGGWAGDAYLILHYAQLQPKVIYDETIERDGLDQYKVLVMADCDVLTESIAAAVERFQARGGIIIGDENLAPAIKPDILLQTHARPKEADAARRLNQEKAAALRKELDAHYARYRESSNPDVITRCRTFGSTDYVFTINDLREYGKYVGHHGLVMENGLPSDAAISVHRGGGHVYDLVNHQEVPAEAAEGRLAWNVHLGPCEGRVFMVTDNAIDSVDVTCPQEVKRGESVEVNVGVTDDTGKLLDAVAPVRVEIIDPEGRPAEFSGYYGAEGGRLSITLQMAANDYAGLWTIRATELASAKTATRYMRLSE
ncbi:MAG TPA: hypothetical protein DGT21_15860 [Armatimonadetes bacterium]|jgi:hypothetical protein|nr:hypothetical protein [Armatimonadota bacterium]